MHDIAVLTQFATRLLEARRSGVAIPQISAGAGPASTAEAHAVQVLQMTALGPVGGWKIAPAKPGKPHKWCPIPASAVSFAGKVASHLLYVAVEVEIEIGLLLSRDIPVREVAYRPEEMLEYVASIHPCMELLLSRYTDRHAVTEAQTIADLQSNLAVIVGPAIAHITDLAFTNSIHFALNGSTVPHAKAKPTMAQVLVALADLANEAPKYGLVLAQDHVVISGARIGPLSLPDNAFVEIALHNAAPFTVQFVAGIS